MAILSACSRFPLDHYIIYPTRVPPQTTNWSYDVQKGNMLIHLEWAAPHGSGPFPTVVVHPEAGKTAHHMQGIIWDLANQGYLAVAVDYKRMIHGEFQRSLFPWREKADATAALEIILSEPRVNIGRIGVLGFSQGGVFSLLIAAAAPDKIKAVVAYYPVTDFNLWLNIHRTNPIQRIIFCIVKKYFYKESNAQSKEEFQQLLNMASPYYHAERIRAATLLIHGKIDTTASVEESERMAARLAELGRDVKLIVVEDATHAFNFKDREKASQAWIASITWFDDHLRSQ